MLLAPPATSGGCAHPGTVAILPSTPRFLLPLHPLSVLPLAFPAASTLQTYP